ncbi:tetratricopeptide repeat protein [Flavobacteriaceae bacterium GSB9]|nr:tetratricopeptide repeat protein [Flavobacteriaceae bacterium GSB9]
MTKKLFVALYLITSLSIFSQEKIPFIDYDTVYSQASKAIQENDYEKTIDILDQINKNDSTYASVLISKSYYLLNSEKYEEAIKVTDEGLRLNNYDTNLSFYINKGLAFASLEKYNEAIQIYNEGLKTYPNYYLLWYNKGVALETLNKINEAVYAYQQAILFNPTYAKSHLQLGNICYNQELMSQALLCYNMYLLLTFDENGAFNTLKSLNNLVAEKNENIANPELQISDDDKHFENIDLVLSNKIALNENYETGNKIDIALTRQNHALITQLEDFEGGNGFWDKKYIPFFQWIKKNNLFDNFTYTLSYSIQNEKYAKIIKQKEKEIKEFVDLFYPKWHDVLKDNTLVFQEKKQEVSFNYYNGYVQAIGKMNNTVSIGKWNFYNQNGQLISVGSYNDKGERTSTWTWFHNNGKTKETANYKNGFLEGENRLFHKNGKPYIYANYLNNELNGEYLYYNDKGALIQKKFFKNGELDGLYQSYFPVGKDLLEFNIPYKNGSISNLAHEYYADGTVYAEMPFREGTRQGVEKKYFLNKKVSSETNYIDGELNGSYKSYYTNGNTLEEGHASENYYNGPWKSYYRDGTLQASFSYNQGSLDGEYKYFDTDGKPYYDYLYRKGEIIEYKYYDKKGNVLSEGKKKGGEFQFKGHHPNGNILSKGLYDITGGKEGYWEFFSKNGVLIEKGNYSKNKATGEYILYHNNGKVESISNYVNDSLSGYYSNYFKNGQLKRQGWYKNNLGHGEWQSYYIDGTLQVINFYHKDKLHGVQEFYSVDGKLEHTSKYRYGELLEETYFDIQGNLINTVNYEPNASNFTIKILHQNKTPNVVIDYVNGIKHGKYLGYDFYGNKSTEGNYWNGAQDGKWIWYYDNGKTESAMNYKNGNLNGESLNYYEDGAVEAQLFYEYGKRVNTWVRYHENGKKARTTDYVDDVLHGKTVFYCPSGNLQLTRYYNHGTLIGYSYLDKNSKELPMIPITNETTKITSYYNNGNIARELEYKNGNLINSYKIYFYSGQLKEQMHFIDDEYDGLNIEYYENGKIKTESNYNMGVLEGLVKKYHKSGKLKELINYKNDKRSGETHYYNENQKLVKKEFYFNGELYRSKTY